MESTSEPVSASDKQRSSGTGELAYGAGAARDDGQINTEAGVGDSPAPGLIAAACIVAAPKSPASSSLEHPELHASRDICKEC